MTTTNAESWRSVSDEGLRFFGEMSASVSHEIRNKLAVINEKAGLVQDIAAAMKTGRPIDPERLEIQAGKIIDQIREANRIVGALNRLGHVVDETRARIDVTTLVDLVAELCGHKASSSEITIDSTGPADGVVVTTNPFLLADLIGACIDAALPRVDGSCLLAITSEPGGDGAVIRFRHLEGVDESDVELGGEASGARAMLAVLGGRVTVDRERGEIIFEIGDGERHASGSHQ